MKYLFIFSLFFLNTESKNGFLYEVEAKNGGPNGFNNSVLNCNPHTRSYSANYSDPGYEKYQNPCGDKLPKEVLKLRDMCNNLISQNKDTSGVSNLSGCNLTFAIKDRFNFRYTISK